MDITRDYEIDVKVTNLLLGGWELEEDITEAEAEEILKLLGIKWLKDKEGKPDELTYH